MDRDGFFEKYNIEKDEFEKTGLNFGDLIDIKNHFLNIQEDLETTDMNVSERLRKIKEVHSVKTRLKDPEHLMEKIIRKKMKDPTLEINLNNYFNVITDLVGVRALHLFKEDWEPIHHFIIENWEIKEKPTSYIREGDPKELIKKYEENNCDIKYHPNGYRSIHYLVETKPTKRLTLVEIQVRTIFEEAWSEIDHQIRYPYDADNPILLPYLLIFNQLAGNADEMGSFIKFLKNELGTQKKIIDQQNQTIKELEKRINELKIADEEKKKLQDEINSLRLKRNALDLSTTSAIRIAPFIRLSGLVLTDPKILEASKKTRFVTLKHKRCSKCHHWYTPTKHPDSGLCKDCDPTG